MYQEACEVADVADGEVLWCQVNGQDLAVYRVEGRFFASEDRCSHGRTALSEGELEGFAIVCPLHQGRFDVRTGEPVGLPCIKPIRIYPVEVQEGRVMVSMQAGD